MQRDNFTCQYCGLRCDESAIEIDHIIPVSKGGNDFPTNLTVSCFDCNRGKSDVDIAREKASDMIVINFIRELQFNCKNEDIDYSRQGNWFKHSCIAAAIHWAAYIGEEISSKALVSKNVDEKETLQERVSEFIKVSSEMKFRK